MNYGGGNFTTQLTLTDITLIKNLLRIGQKAFTVLFYDITNFWVKVYSRTIVLEYSSSTI